ncbi:hypothetical protein ACEP6V_19660 [Pseudomonas aeruginosa]|nr:MULTISPECIES: hypothetical protein [Pseudomonas aeruginosa group]MCK0982530.1 hypothetical protein [Pseudomonas aeruginosa]MCK1182669.1 hypothetical protein [Pseudomonas aeruginosa]MCL8242926.1 hypothetical protein [Pseudomonas aeruginosa]MCL8271381.1 hypothetical protein [Pseudomonas aeruginosa]MCR8339349.1 hypothetical protein [Pseudomonas aeruginosa]
MPSQYSHNTDDLTPVDALPGWKKTLGGVLALGMDLLNARHDSSWVEGYRAGEAYGSEQKAKSQSQSHAVSTTTGPLEIRDLRERSITAPRIDQVLIDDDRLVVSAGLLETMQRDAASLLPADLQPTPGQWKAIATSSRALLVSGQGGTGKSFTLAMRALYLHKYLMQPLSSIRVVVDCKEVKEEFAKRLHWLFRRWSIECSEADIQGCITTPAAAALELVNSLVGWENVRPFEVRVNSDVFEIRPFDTRLSSAQTSLLRTTHSKLYRSNPRYAELVVGLFRQSMLLEPLEVDHPDVVKRAAIGWKLSQHDQDLCEKVETLWKEAGAWPLDGIKPGRHKVVVRGCEFSLHGFVPRLDAFVLLGFDRTEDRYLTRGPGIKLEVYKECEIKKTLLQAYLDKPVIHLDSYQDAKQMVATLKALPTTAPDFGYRLRGEPAHVPLVEAFYQVATLVENLGMGVPQAVGKLNFLQNDPDALFFEGLGHFWLGFEGDLLANDPPLMTINRLLDLFSERHGANLKRLPAAALNRFRHLLLDDAQDTSAPTADFLRGILSEFKRRAISHRDSDLLPSTFTLAGDPVQASFATQGSSSQGLRHFDTEFRVSNPTRVILQDGFRGHQHLIDAAFSVVRNQVDVGRQSTALIAPTKQSPVEIHSFDSHVLIRLLQEAVEGGGDVLVLVDSIASYQMAEAAVAYLVGQIDGARYKGKIKIRPFQRARPAVAETVILAGNFTTRPRSDFRNQLFNLAGRWAESGTNHYDALLDQEIQRLVHTGITRARTRCYWLVPSVDSSAPESAVGVSPALSNVIVDKR